jgi:hypothetical protein
VIDIVKGMEIPMSNFLEKCTEQWRDSGSLVLGLWLLFSPWLLGYTAVPTVAWTAYIVGIIVAVIALTGLVAYQRWGHWPNAVLGFWLIISPWIVSYADAPTAMWNHMVVGALLLILAIWSATTEYRMVTKG